MLWVTRWLWRRGPLSARLARLLLLPPAWAYRSVTAVRAWSYRRHLLPQSIPTAPTVAVGNLTVGGSGKTPVASWIASYYAERGIRPGIVLRGYGGDEGAVHRVLVPQAVVVEDPDRVAAAEQAAEQGAEVIVLDDAYQRLDVARDLNIAVVSAESSRAVPWTLPAGPWREGWRALRRADLVVITRKRAGRVVAQQVADRVRRTAPRAGIAVAHLAIRGFRSMRTGDRLALEQLAGTRVLASAGVGDPDAFAEQCRDLGASVQLAPWRDHHRYSSSDVRRLLQAAGEVDYVVVTEKDAAKLRGCWPAEATDPLVAALEVRWERGRTTVETALEAVATDIDTLLT
jgi:tetraacyldisaccharide 4'-kinase